MAGAGARSDLQTISVRSRALSVRRNRQAARRPQSQFQAGGQRPTGPRGPLAAAVRRHGFQGSSGAGEILSSSTATAPAKIYNLHPRKGSIAVGADADIAIWDPRREVTLSDAMMHDLSGYTPFAGRKLRGWPVTVLSRGRVIIADGKRSVEAGTGRFLVRTGGEAAKPTGRLMPDMDPEQNFWREAAAELPRRDVFGLIDENPFCSAALASSASISPPHCWRAVMWLRCSTAPACRLPRRKILPNPLTE